MAKSKPILTHTKILCLAIRCLENEIDNMKAQYEGKAGAEALLQHYISERTPELDALKEMYRIETGVAYI